MIIIHFITVSLQDWGSSSAKQTSSLKPTGEVTLKAFFILIRNNPKQTPIYKWKLWFPSPPGSSEIGADKMSKHKDTMGAL